MKFIEFTRQDGKRFLLDIDSSWEILDLGPNKPAAWCNNKEGRNLDCAETYEVVRTRLLPAPECFEPLSATEKDATRYEWLRQHFLELVWHSSCGVSHRSIDLVEVQPRLGQALDPQTLDQAIDAAMERHGG